ncbi:MAG: thioredoxin domain-containing protein, partial [Saprospiraceae bacterium]
MNHLQYETSPYLLQHAHNPVQWYAWKPEALEKARREQKPILVSIGYSTCHWCHVMERESFENPDIAAFMNEHFVNIKVDREERPDLDAIYMEACQILTGSGGWPLNCFLTPDGRPFYAGTYYPPRPAYNRPSWLQVLQHLSNAWESQREAVFEQAEKLLDHILRQDDILIGKPEQNPVSPFGPAGPGGALETIFYQMRDRFDRLEGGFGGAPKFPSTMAIRYLLGYYWFSGREEALEHALLSLDKMIHGGIYDQLGGGFARYATDRAWLVPHFEKMLYDNALLVALLAETVKLLQSDAELAHKHAAQLETYRETLEETLDYIAREMMHPEGGFYAAQDADSEGVEGKFFVWEKEEIDAALGAESPLFCAFYGVTAEGNWEHRNILWRAQGDYGTYAAAQGLEVQELKKRLAACRGQLFRLRAGRVWPGLDDKLLLGWNALMVSGYAAAFTATGADAYQTAAQRALDFILVHFDDGTGGLLHTWKAGKAQYAALLDDYALLIAALTDVYQIAFDPKYLSAAGRYTEFVFRHFSDPDTGVF